MIRKYLEPLRSRMIFGLTIKAAGTALELVFPWLLSHMIREVAPSGSISTIILWGLLMLLFAVLAAIGNIVGNRNASYVAARASARIRHDLFARIISLDSQDFYAVGISSLQSRLTSDVWQVNRMLAGLQRMGIRAPVLLVGGLISTMIMDPVIGFVLLILAPIIWVFAGLINKYGRPLFRKVQNHIDILVRRTRDTTRGIRTIKSSNREAHVQERFGIASDNLSAAEKKASFTLSLSWPFLGLLLNFGLVAIIYIGALRIKAGFTDTATIIAFISYFAMITQGIMAMTRIFLIYTRGMTSANRIEEVLKIEQRINFVDDEQLRAEYAAAAPDILNYDLQRERDIDLDKSSSGLDFSKLIRGKSEDDSQTDMIPEAGGEPDSPKAGKSARIEFRNVFFAYPQTGAILKNISFKVEPGQTLGILGPTGSGKTTIIRLLLRLYEPDSGEILINDRNLTEWPRRQLYKLFGVVLQNDFLYASTIADNISFGRRLYHEDIFTAGEYAQADDFIREKPGGYEHPTQPRASNLSGGQRQRILLARALAQNPCVLVLDDATSALDYETDARFRRMLFDNFSRTTRVIIAQRVSSVLQADTILMIREGEVIALGSPRELDESSPEWQQICREQLDQGGAFVNGF
ncbi:MAG: ABC transporter ATP-binding protein [Clostridiaceae bacterium]|nr:ABC transporter ATP-binding protein [Clostridiaceae bacterium]